MPTRRNIGFDGRTFLTEEEWRTYCRRKPVRYIRRPKNDKCNVCGADHGKDNPMQNAHRIGFDIGIIDLALTPDFLDSMTNIVSAHKVKCNKASELSLKDSMQYLRSLAIEELPKFLPDDIQKAWRESAGD
jgi:hypothetical protein